MKGGGGGFETPVRNICTRGGEVERTILKTFAGIEVYRLHTVNKKLP